MIIKERVYKTCECCGITQMVSDEEYGCDHCGLGFDLGEDYATVSATLFWKNKESERLDFCSWKCALARLGAISTDCFIDFPSLHYDTKAPQRDAAAFWQAVREFGQN